MSNNNSNTLWQSYAVNRVWVCRAVVITSAISVVVQTITSITAKRFKFDVLTALATLIVFLIALLSPRVRDNITAVSIFSVLWVVFHVVTTAASIVFVLNDGESFLYPFGLHTNEQDHHLELTIATMRIEPIPFVMLLILAVMGVPAKICLPLGVVVFACEIATVLVFAYHVTNFSPTDCIHIVVNKLFNAVLMLYFTHNSETHQRKAHDSMVILRHTLRQWLAQREADSAVRQRIVAYIFHEVRNPLNNIMLASDLLRDRIQQILETPTKFPPNYIPLTRTPTPTTPTTPTAAKKTATPTETTPSAPSAPSAPSTTTTVAQNTTPEIPTNHSASSLHRTSTDNNYYYSNDEVLEINEMLETISKAADSACHVLNDALSLQKLETGTFEFVKQPFALGKLHTQAIRVAAPMMQQKNITLNSHIDKSLQRVNVFGDFNRLQQVLNNFLSNAYKFTPNDGTVTARTAKVSEISNDHGRAICVRFSVQDSGPGVAESDQAKVFVPWSQVRATDLQQGPGSGLGLSLCKSFVEVGHNGRIGFKSTPGSGALFYFEVDFLVCDETPQFSRHVMTQHMASRNSSPTLSNLVPSPMVEHQPSNVSVISSAAAATLAECSSARTGTGTPIQSVRGVAKVVFPRSGSDHTDDGSATGRSTELQMVEQARRVVRVGGGLTSSVNFSDSEPEDDVVRKDVLIVDDSLVTRKLLSKILEVMCVTFDTCENGKQAIDKILVEHHIYSLVLIDKEMPVMDGFEAARALRVAQYHLPVVGLTGNAMDDQVSDFLSAGVNSVLHKPINREVLLRVLTQYGIQVKSQPTATPRMAPPNLAPRDVLPEHDNKDTKRKSVTRVLTLDESAARETVQENVSSPPSRPTSIASLSSRSRPPSSYPDAPLFAQAKHLQFD